MNLLKISLDDKAYDDAVRGAHEGPPSLRECGDLAIFVKKGAMVSGAAAAVVTFTVELPDGSHRRVQAVNTVANFINALAVLKGWQDGGHLK